MLRENSKLNTIKLPINRGFSYEKRRTLREKTPPTLCQNRESSLKFTRIPLFIKAYYYFFKSKWGFSFNLVWDQANSPRIKSSTFNYSFNLETSNHDSRSSLIALSNRNVSWRLNKRNLLYSFIVKIHTENCTHIYIYIYIYIQIKYKLIICYTISWLCDSSLRKLCVQMCSLYLPSNSEKLHSTLNYLFIFDESHVFICIGLAHSSVSIWQFLLDASFLTYN